MISVCPASEVNECQNYTDLKLRTAFSTGGGARKPDLINTEMQVFK